MKRVEIAFDYCFCVIKIKKMTSKQAFHHQVQMRAELTASNQTDFLAKPETPI